MKLIESELNKCSKVRPMQLLLPSLYSELSGSALPDIIEKLKTTIEQNNVYNNISSINVDTANFINKNNIRPPTFIEKNNISIEKK